MKFYSLGFNFINREGCTWGKNPSTTFSINLYSVGAYCHTYVDMQWECGRFPLFRELQYAMRVFFKKTLMDGILQNNVRIGAEKFRFITRYGGGDNYTLFVERSVLDKYSYPERVKLLYVSGEDKVANIRRMRLEDFILLGIWMGVLVPSRNADDIESIRFWFDPDTNYFFSRCRVIEPRDTSKEEGWYDPFTVPYNPEEVCVN